MNNSIIIIIIYFLGLVFGALVLDIWSAETSPKTLLGIGWTALLLIGLFLQKKMKKIKLIYLISIFLFISNSQAEKIILSSCDNKRDGFLKNEYILDLDQSIMTRNYVFNEKTYKEYRITDLSVKKQNKIERLIYKKDNKILTEKLGYPQFFTQLIFEIDSPLIKIKTVINNEEGVDLLSTCKKIERFKKES
tara:strand:+ start:207 stop:782 length:576 start_codon:yes stop_codon:yes gene_type:complete